MIGLGPRFHPIRAAGLRAVYIDEDAAEHAS
jgi:hypothetical protein